MSNALYCCGFKKICVGPLSPHFETLGFSNRPAHHKALRCKDFAPQRSWRNVAAGPVKVTGLSNAGI